MFKINPHSKSQAKASSPSDPIKSTQDDFPFTEEGIRARAQQVYERRKAAGLKGTSEEDWQQAIRELQWERSVWAKFGRWTGLGQKKGWDIVQLLTSISIPVAIFAGGSLFTYWNNQQQQRIADQRREQDLQTADDNRKQEAFNKYLDQMAASLKDGLLMAQPGSEQFTIAQARTVTTLLSLDKKRRNLLIQFLSASGLNQVGDKVTFGKEGNVKLGKGDWVLLYKAQMVKVNLANSDLSGAVLIGANLRDTSLECVPPDSRDLNQCSDLSNADLRGTNLSDADLRSANLSKADLRSANLSEADLRSANLSNANLRYTDLSWAKLNGANLLGANLKGANLWRAYLKEAQGLIDKQLSEAFLCKTILPERSELNPNRDCK